MKVVSVNKKLQIGKTKTGWQDCGHISVSKSYQNQKPLLSNIFPIWRTFVDQTVISINRKGWKAWQTNKQTRRQTNRHPQDNIFVFNGKL